MAANRQSRITIALLALSLLCSSYVRGETITAVDAASLYPSETTYSIYRKGKLVGKHSLNIRIENDQVDVEVDSQITITVLKIPVFKFRYLSTERWQNNQLISVDSTTITNKKVETASLQNVGDNSVVTKESNTQTIQRIAYATNHWNVAAVGQASLFNTVKGVKSDITVTTVGQETITIGDKQLNTTHYAYSGDIVAETWYDQNNRWVKLAFLGTDGSQITYVINNP